MRNAEPTGLRTMSKTEPSFKPVSTKKDFVERYQKGEFGNASPTWSVSDWLNQNTGSKDQLYHLRNKKKGGSTHYNLKEQELYQMILGIARDHYDRWYVSAMAPTDKTMLQGEVQRTSEGLYLTYTKVKKPMRQALKEEQLHARNLQALHLIRSYMDVASSDWLEHLLDAYPDHIVEFSVYSKEWGTVPGYNTVFWEVRNY